jgi:predicted ester cyclase
MTGDELVDADLADLYGAYLIFRESDQGVEGFRKYMRQVFDPKEPDFDQAVSNIIAEFARVAAGETKAIH